MLPRHWHQPSHRLGCLCSIITLVCLLHLSWGNKLQKINPGFHLIILQPHLSSMAEEKKRHFSNLWAFSTSNFRYQCQTLEMSELFKRFLKIIYNKWYQGNLSESHYQIINRENRKDIYSHKTIHKMCNLWFTPRQNWHVHTSIYRHTHAHMHRRKI